jgi:hypothetical protein
VVGLKNAYVVVQVCSDLRLQAGKMYTAPWKPLKVKKVTKRKRMARNTVTVRHGSGINVGDDASLSELYVFYSQITL